MKKICKPFKFLCLAVAFTVLMTSVPVAAGTTYKNRWLVKNERVYFYNAKGNKSTGKKKINGKYYYFNSDGVQYTGWQKYKGDYYFFQIANGSKGSMVTSKKVDGITLTSTGKAQITSASLRKLKLLYRANQIMETLTNKKSKMSKIDKLRLCFNYCKKQQLTGAIYLDPSSAWDQSFAEYLLYYNRGDCTALAAGFAYLANAVGYDQVAVITSSAGYAGHAWAEVSGKVYDPDWSLMDLSHDYFGMSYDMSGTSALIPNYRANRLYVVNL